MSLLAIYSVLMAAQSSVGSRYSVKALAEFMWMLTLPPVTGGAGYLGVQAAETILESGGDVVALDIALEPGNHGVRSTTLLAILLLFIFMT